MHNVTHTIEPIHGWDLVLQDTNIDKEICQLYHHYFKTWVHGKLIETGFTWVLKWSKSINYGY